jgi:activator of 2-hydroxyglutaryl-CoA dehydratase
MSEGCSINRLAAGVNYSLFRRIKPLIERFPGEILILSGGVAKSKAIKHFIEKEMNFSKVMVLPRPQINGAIGCCVHAMANS